MKLKSSKISKLHYNEQQQLLYFDLFSYKMITNDSFSAMDAL